MVILFVSALNGRVKKKLWVQNYSPVCIYVYIYVIVAFIFMFISIYLNDKLCPHMSCSCTCGLLY